MKNTLKTAALLGISLLIGCSAIQAGEHKPRACFANGWDKSSLLNLKAQNFEVDAATLSLLSHQFISCLAVKDPEIRDGVAFEAYSHWLRNGLMAEGDRTALFNTLIQRLNSVRDKSGVYRPFLVLVLAEVVRVDRITPYLSEAQREEAVAALTSYLQGIEDYRGFSERAGWRHGVAHSADMVLQLALNRGITSAQLERLSGAVASQIKPKTHSYIYGEPERLALATAYLMYRDELPLSYWQNWVKEIAQPEGFDSWGEVFKSKSGLAMRHNLRSFLKSLYELIEASSNPRYAEIKVWLKQELGRSA